MFCDKLNFDLIGQQSRKSNTNNTFLLQICLFLWCRLLKFLFFTGQNKAFTTLYKNSHAVISSSKCKQRLKKEPKLIAVTLIFPNIQILPLCLQVLVLFRGCGMLDFEASSQSIKTGYFPPSQVESAFVFSTYECIVEIPVQPYNRTNMNATAYQVPCCGETVYSVIDISNHSIPLKFWQIEALSAVNRTTRLFIIHNTNIGRKMHLTVPTDHHGFDQRINLTVSQKANFQVKLTNKILKQRYQCWTRNPWKKPLVVQITSVSHNCSGPSTKIRGYCVSPGKSRSYSKLA